MKFKPKFNEVEAVRFDYTPEGIATLAGFTGSKFRGIMAEPNARGQMVALIGDLRVNAGDYIFKRHNNGFSCLKAGLVSLLFVPVVAEEEVPVMPLAVAMEAAKAKAQPAPAVVVEALGAVETEPSEALVTRDFALSHDLIRYFTGEACRNGHVAERYTRGQCCVTCIAEATERSRKRAKAVVKRNTTRALKACSGPFAPLAASISH